MAFHEVRFPAGISLGATRRPGAAHRDRGARLGRRGAQQPLGRFAAAATTPATASSRVDDLHAVIAFFEERRGRLLRLPLARLVGLEILRARRDADARSTSRSALATARRRPSSSSKTYGCGVRALAARDHQAGGGDGAASRSAAWRWPRRRISRSTSTTGLVTFLAEHIPAIGAVGDGRLRVRRAGALRYRPARDQSAARSRPGDPAYPHRRGAAAMRMLPTELQAHLAKRRDDACAGAGG